MILRTRQVLVVRRCQEGVPVGLAGQMQLVDRLQVLKERVRKRPAVEEFVSPQEIEQQLEVSHIKVLFRWLTARIIHNVDI